MVTCLVTCKHIFVMVTIYSFRAEKLRCAAKYRREEESELLSELAALLPYKDETVAKLDKGAILRLTVSYLQMKSYTRQGRVTMQ